MKTITIPRQQVNITALDETLENALAENYLGLSVYGGEVRVHLVRETPTEQVQQAEQIVRDHDPTQLTPEQQAELLQRQNLLQARADNPTLLDIDGYSSSDTLIQQLAYKIQWLEQEIRDLRDL
jgi:hypothetical protein